MHNVNSESHRPQHESQTSSEKILVWLPSPLGDAVLCTPALRALRRHFESGEIFFYGNSVVRRVLSPSSFNDGWLEQKSSNPLAVAGQLRECNFTYAVLFKNSFSSALACFLAGISSRTGYAREGRGFLLTDKLRPPKLPGGGFKPVSMIDYYNAIVSRLGADTSDRNLELSVDPAENKNLVSKLPELNDIKGPLVILVPGGAFGPSKCWPSERFAQTADRLIDRYNATIVVSVSPVAAERSIAGEICQSSRNKFINLGNKQISLGMLKALYARADLVISNDTGPRHIAIAFRRKVVTLFGPNDPAWTDTGYENEIQIVGKAPCVPCRRPTCKLDEHLCMESISVKMVCDAAGKLLDSDIKQQKPEGRDKFIEVSKSYFMDVDYQEALIGAGLNSIDSIFAFENAQNLTKDNLAKFRSRLKFEIDSSESVQPVTVFLKRYNHPPVFVQLKNWLASHGRKSCGLFEADAAGELNRAGINAPKTVAYGEQWGILFEKRSFVITKKLPNAESLERRLPDFYNGSITKEKLRQRRSFIARLAKFVKHFHATGYRHRDLYFSHIFYSQDDRFYLIDLARAFKPIIFHRRFQVKDIAQLHYSAPAGDFSRTDRLRFYREYTGHRILTDGDKIFIRKVVKKAARMARHDSRHGRQAPYMS